MDNFDKLFGDAEKMVTDMKKKNYNPNFPTTQQYTKKTKNENNLHSLSAPERINSRNKATPQNSRGKNNNNKNNSQKSPYEKSPSEFNQNNYRNKPNNNRSNNQINNNNQMNKKSPQNKSSPTDKNNFKNNYRNNSNSSLNSSERSNIINNTNSNSNNNYSTPSYNFERDNKTNNNKRNNYQSPKEKELVQKFSLYNNPIQFVKGETLIDYTREESSSTTSNLPKQKLFSSFSIIKISPVDQPDDNNLFNNNIIIIEGDDNEKVIDSENENTEEINIIDNNNHNNNNNNIDTKEIILNNDNEDVKKEEKEEKSVNIIDLRNVNIKNKPENKNKKINKKKNNKNDNKKNQINNNKNNNRNQPKKSSIPITIIKDESKHTNTQNENNDDSEEEIEEDDFEEENILQFNLQSLLSFCKQDVDEMSISMPVPTDQSISRLSSLIPNKVEYYSMEYYFSSDSDEENENEIDDDNDSDDLEIEDDIDEDEEGEFSDDDDDEEDEDDEMDDDDDEDDSDDDDEYDSDEIDDLIAQLDEEEEEEELNFQSRKVKKIKQSKNGKGFIPWGDDNEGRKVQQRLRTKFGDFELLDENLNFIDDPVKKIAAMKKFDSVVNGNFKLKNGKSPNKKKAKRVGNGGINSGNYFTMKKQKKNKKMAKKQKSKNKLNTNTIDILYMNREIKKFISDDENEEFYLPPMRKSCLSHVCQLAEFYSIRVTSSSPTLVGPNKLKVLRKTQKTGIPNDPMQLQNLDAYLRSFDSLVGQRGKQLGKRKDQRLSQSPSEGKDRSSRLKVMKGKLVAETAPPIEASNVGYILLRGMGWDGGALSQSSLLNNIDRVYSTPDGKPLTTPLPAIIKIGKKGIGF